VGRQIARKRSRHDNRLNVGCSECPLPYGLNGLRDGDLGQRRVVKGIVTNRRQRIRQLNGCQISAIKDLVTNRDHRIRKNQLCQVRATKSAILKGDQRIWKVDLRQARFIKGETTNCLKGARENYRKKEIVLTEREFRDRSCTFFNNQLITVESVVKAHETILNGTDLSRQDKICAEQFIFIRFPTKYSPCSRSLASRAPLDNAPSRAWTRPLRALMPSATYENRPFFLTCSESWRISLLSSRSPEVHD